MIIYHVDDALAVVRDWWRFISDVPDELSVWLNFSRAPPEPFIPEEYHGEKIVSVIPVCAGNIKEGEGIITSLRKFGNPIVDTVEPRRFVEWQQAFDESYPAGKRYYWKSHNLKSPSDEALRLITEYALRLQHQTREYR